jgi:hypothetical protein
MRTGAVALLALSALAPSVRAQEASPAPASSGVIMGRVVANGGAPVRGATIQAVGLVERGTRLSADVGDDGTFALTGLAPGAYSVFVDAPGYVWVGHSGGEAHRPGDVLTVRLTKGGVVTGKVADAAGKPVVEVYVRAMRTRDASGDRERSDQRAGAYTDDLGVYRIFGLDAGDYVVCAGGARGGWYRANAFAGDVPTYYPSARRETATEVTVGLGDEVTGIDIQYRGEAGHSVSGTLAGVDGARYAWIALTAAEDGAPVASTSVSGGAAVFTLEGVPDGNYLAVATASTGEVESSSPAVRVFVRGADVAGVRLAVAPLGSVAGRFVLEKPSDPEPCPERPAHAVAETLLRVYPTDTSAPARAALRWTPTSAVRSDGAIEVKNLPSGTYRVAMDLPDARWYVKSVVVGAAKSDAARSGVRVAAPGRVADLVVTAAHGAASVSGRVKATREDEGLPARTTVVLVPGEAEGVDDVLRYFEAEVGSDGAFSLEHVPPGVYRAFARVREARGVRAAALFAFDAAERKALRALAAKGVALELAPCSTRTDEVIPYADGGGK